MMTRTQYLLTLAASECNELAHRLLKAAQFGIDQVQPPDHNEGETRTDSSLNPEGLSNRDRIRREYIHLIAVMDDPMLLGLGVVDMSWSSEADQNELADKVLKAHKYLEISGKYGAVGPDPSRQDASNDDIGVHHEQITSHQSEVLCKHGTAMDVHCCGDGGLPYPGCHSGFLFNPESCRCDTSTSQGDGATGTSRAPSD